MVYSIKQKIDICLMAESNPEMTQSDLAIWAKTQYSSSKPPSQTTISRILAKKDELISLKQHELKLIRRRRLSNPLLRMVLMEWISQSVWNNIPVTAPIIINSATNFWNNLPDNLKEGNGEFSYKWCSQFLSKLNINLNNIESELYNQRLKIWTFEERDKLKILFEDFDIKNIFTLNEIFLSHDIPLDKSFYKDQSDFITCMLCSNADGSEKLDPLIIGRFENYPSFNGKPSIKIANKYGVSYHSNRKKWLTSTVFYDWLSVLDKRLALTNRQIIIILDDSASHRVINLKLQRIRLLFTNANSTNFLPNNWGIENDFRLLFRIEQYEKLINLQKIKNNQLLIEDELKFSMTDIFQIVKKSWLQISQSRIQSSWKQSGILPDTIANTFPKRRIFDDKLEIQLFQNIENFKTLQNWDVLSLLDLNVEQKINETFLSNDEIIESCITDNYEDFDHDNISNSDGNNINGIQKRNPFSHELGRSFQALQRFGEYHKVVNSIINSNNNNHINNLKNNNNNNTNNNTTNTNKEKDNDIYNELNDNFNFNTMNGFNNLNIDVINQQLFNNSNNNINNTNNINFGNNPSELLMTNYYYQPTGLGFNQLNQFNINNMDSRPTSTNTDLYNFDSASLANFNSDEFSETAFQNFDSLNNSPNYQYPNQYNSDFIKSESPTTLPNNNDPQQQQVFKDYQKQMITASFLNLIKQENQSLIHPTLINQVQELLQRYIQNDSTESTPF
ncbi:hypothetical protein WICMUC_005526 [Wickerhamomyces mucosus]|uniref:HTH CENPB-type domain-containing protein n=1 Tax=Wickerhamomyces mucosus TaxID=1378264 RepID=A0A9P8T5U5_9ASCO|nr:hypothetical protein WICMUC_005526 [Wickerhamomyces mucosus]